MADLILGVLAGRTPHHYELLDDRRALPGTDEGFWSVVGSPKPDAPIDLFDAFPELVGLEEDLEGILAGAAGRVTLPELSRETRGTHGGRYFDLSVLRDPALSDRVIVLVEDITERASSQQLLLQSRNEIALLKGRLEQRTVGLRRTAHRLATARRQLARLNDEVRRYSHDLERTVRERTRELKSSRLEVIRRLAQAAEFRDQETGQHVNRMSRYAVLLARRAGLSESECDLLFQATPLHDIGKIAVPDSILLKPGPLTTEERRAMQAHTTQGHQLLAGSDSDLMTTAAAIARGHHERWDGNGYPDGLAGAAIPLVARICAVTDVFDALTSRRPYKEPWPAGRAWEEIRARAGAHFDPELVRVFLTVEPEVERIRVQFAEGDPDLQLLDTE